MSIPTVAWLAVDESGVEVEGVDCVVESLPDVFCCLIASPVDFSSSVGAL